MMAIALLFTSSAFAYVTLDVTEGPQAEDTRTGANRMGIYQPITISLANLQDYVGVNKMIKVWYWLDGSNTLTPEPEPYPGDSRAPRKARETVTPDENAPDKTDYIRNEKPTSPVLSKMMVMDNLLPNTVYSYAVVVETYTGEELGYYNGTFNSYPGDVTVAPVDVVSIKQGIEYVRFDFDKSQLKTVSGETADPDLVEFTSVKLTRTDVTPNEVINLTEVEDGVWIYENTTDEKKLVYGATYQPAASVVYNEKDPIAIEGLEAITFNPNQQQINPLWITVVPDGTGYAIELTGVPDVTSGLAYAAVWTKCAGETTYNEASCNKPVELVDGALTVRFTAAELAGKDANVFTGSTVGFDFNLSLYMIIGTDPVVAWTIDNCHVFYSKNAIQFPTTPKWNDGAPTITGTLNPDFGRNAVKAVNDAFNALVEDGYYTATDADADEAPTYLVSVNGNDQIEGTRSSWPKIVTFNLDTADFDDDEATQFAYTTDVVWSRYLVVEQSKKNFYPNATSPVIFEEVKAQDANNVFFEDYGKIPAAFDILGVRVNWDEKQGTTDLQDNVVALSLPQKYNDGTNIGNVHISVYFYDEEQNDPWVLVGQDAVAPNHVDATTKRFGHEVVVDPALITNHHGEYNDVKVVITGDSYTYENEKEDDFSCYNTDGTITIKEVIQPISIELERINAVPVFEINGFTSILNPATDAPFTYTITATLTELDASGNPVGTPVTKTYEGLKETDEDVADVLNEAIFFSNLNEKTQYKVTATLSYAVERDPLATDDLDNEFDTYTVTAEAVFTTLRVPGPGQITALAPKYYLSDTENQIIVRLRFLVEKEDDEEEVKVEVGWDKDQLGDYYDELEEEGLLDMWNFHGTFTAELNEDDTHDTYKATNTFPFYEVVPVPTYTVEFPLNVDLSVMTADVPEIWILPYTGYIWDETTQSSIDEDVIGFGENHDYGFSRRIIMTPLPYARFVNSNFSTWRQLSPEVGSLLIEALEEMAANDDETGTGVYTSQEVKWLSILNRLYPTVSAWEAADYAASLPANTFAYSRTVAPGFENASDPKFFGANNLVYNAPVDDPLLFIDEYEDLSVDFDTSLFPEWLLEGLELVQNLFDMEADYLVQGYGYGYGNTLYLPHIGQYKDLVSGELVNVTYADPEVQALAVEYYKWIKYLIAQLIEDEFQYELGNGSEEDLYFWTGDGKRPYAFNVLLQDAPKGSSFAENVNYNYYNDFVFHADNVVYKAIFPSVNRTVVLPFTGKAYLDEAGTEEATVRYFTAGYLDEDNKAVFRFAKKLRNGEASNELTAGYPYMVHADGANYTEVYFIGEDTYVLRNGEESTTGGLRQVEVNLTNYWGDELSTAKMVGTYHSAPDVLIWNLYDYAKYWWGNGTENSLPYEDNFTPYYWKSLKDRMGERMFNWYVTYNPEVSERYQEYLHTSIYRFSSVANTFGELSRVDELKLDEATKARWQEIKDYLIEALEIEVEEGEEISDAELMFYLSFSELTPAEAAAIYYYYSYTIMNWGIDETNLQYVKPFQCIMYFHGTDMDNTGYSIDYRFDDEEDDATVINAVEVENNNSDVFDLMGRKIAEPNNGQIYIKNGKKFMVK